MLIIALWVISPWKAKRTVMALVEAEKSRSLMEIGKLRISIMLPLFKHDNHWHRSRLIFLSKFINAVRDWCGHLSFTRTGKLVDANAVIAVGIAPPHIDGHAGEFFPLLLDKRRTQTNVSGQYNNSLGYHNNTGRVYTSWKVHANTLGLQYGKGMFNIALIPFQTPPLDSRQYRSHLRHIFWWTSIHGITLLWQLSGSNKVKTTRNAHIDTQTEGERGTKSERKRCWQSTDWQTRAIKEQHPEPIWWKTYLLTSDSSTSGTFQTSLSFFAFEFRYHFEADKDQFLPTITFSGGRVDVSVLWPEAVEQLPSISDVGLPCFPSRFDRDRSLLVGIDSHLSMDSSTDGHLRSSYGFLWKSIKIGRFARAITNTIRKILSLFCGHTTGSLANRWKRCQCWISYLFCKRFDQWASRSFSSSYL